MKYRVKVDLLNKEVPGYFCVDVVFDEAVEVFANNLARQLRSEIVMIEGVDDFVIIPTRDIHYIAISVKEEQHA